MKVSQCCLGFAYRFSSWMEAIVTMLCSASQNPFSHYLMCRVWHPTLLLFHCSQFERYSAYINKYLSIQWNRNSFLIGNSCKHYCHRHNHRHYYAADGDAAFTTCLCVCTLVCVCVCEKASRHENMLDSEKSWSLFWYNCCFGVPASSCSYFGSILYPSKNDCIPCKWCVCCDGVREPGLINIDAVD